MATEVLGITEITDSQAAKYATHNEGLRQLEGRMVRVVSRTVTAQPSGVAGATYIIPTGATGTNWATFTANQIAHYYGGTWKNWTPTEGTRVWVNDEDVRLVYNSSAWVLDTKLPMLTKSVAGASNVTLTEAESRYPAIDCTGAITANIALIVTTTPKLLIVKNSTTGAFTLTVKTSAGTGIVVPQGGRYLVYCDGTNVVMADASNANTKVVAASASGTLTLDLSLGRFFDTTLTENVTTLTISNAPVSGNAFEVKLLVRQDSTGGRTFAWGSVMKSPGGTDPTVTSAANAYDLYVLRSVDGGASVLVETVGQNYS
jgi:hypothetical protein